MPLKLTITSFQRLSPDQEATKLLDRGSISIGRATQNDWVLQDPERILSKNHCTVHYRDGAYFLTDLSANGTFLNDSDQRIPRNQTIPLQDGDRFVLGEYEIEATLIPGAAELEESGPEEPLTDIIPAPHILPPDGGGDSPAVPEKPSFADLLAEDQDHLSLKPPLGRPVKGAVITEPSPDLLAPDRAFFEPPELIPGTLPTPPAPPPVPRTGHPPRSSRRFRSPPSPSLRSRRFPISSLQRTHQRQPPPNPPRRSSPTTGGWRRRPRRRPGNRRASPSLPLRRPPNPLGSSRRHWNRRFPSGPRHRRARRTTPRAGDARTG